MQESKIVRQQAVDKPADVCLRCFNKQQQLRFPFVIYCAHGEVLAVIYSPREFTTFRCAPAQLDALVAKLRRHSTPRRAQASVSNEAPHR